MCSDDVKIYAPYIEHKSTDVNFCMSRSIKAMIRWCNDYDLLVNSQKITISHMRKFLKEHANSSVTSMNKKMVNDLSAVDHDNISRQIKRIIAEPFIIFFDFFLVFRLHIRFRFSRLTQKHLTKIILIDTLKNRLFSLFCLIRSLYSVCLAFFSILTTNTFLLSNCFVSVPQLDYDWSE